MSVHKLRVGMIGGGKNSFIGAIHRIAINIDGQAELVAGALSGNSENAVASGKELFLDDARIYTDYRSMLEQESRMPPEKKLDFICIVTPNHVHFDPAIMALEKGFHVAIDKPITLTLAEAKKLKAKLDETGLHLLLTHTYTGYPMIKQARQMVQSGMFGKIRKVYAEYPQGWLSNFIDGENKQASWRTDPGKSGIAGAMGDIGTHAFNMAEYVSGLKVTKICADLNIVVNGRLLDDDGAVLMKFDNGASGVLTATQIAAGEENNVRIRVYGEKGGLDWKQEDANTLLVKWLDKPTEIYRAGAGYLDSYSRSNSRTPPGHPEGYLEAFANHYRNFMMTINSRKSNSETKKEWLDFPGVDEGIRGMAFIENVVRSGKSADKWIDFTV